MSETGGDKTHFQFVLETLDWPVNLAFVVLMGWVLYLDFRERNG